MLSKKFNNVFLKLSIYYLIFYLKFHFKTITLIVLLLSN
jgi:hypothetical protein